MIDTFGPGELAEVERHAMAGRKPALEIMATQPPLKEDDQFYWNSFLRLRHDQPIGMGVVGSIPWASIEKYAERMDLWNTEFEHFESAIRHVEAQFRRLIEHEHKGTSH